MKSRMKLHIKELVKANYQRITIIFCAFLAMVLVSYFYASNIVKQQIQAIGEETMDATQISFSNGLHEAELLYANVVYNVNERLRNGESNQDILEYLTDMYEYYGAKRLIPDFIKVYAYIRGEFLDGSDWLPPEDFSPPDRPWYTLAVDSDYDMDFSEPYIDIETGGMSIALSQQLYDHDGNSYGVVAVVVKLTRIIDYIADHEIASNGYGILLDDGLRFNAHRDNALVGSEIGQAGEGYGRLAKMLVEQRHISAERFTDSDGTDSVAFFRTIFNGWYIGAVIPRASYYEQANIMGIVLGGLGFALMLVLTYMLVQLHAKQMRSEEESRSKSSFLSRMSHEMRTPMNAIIGMTDIAAKSDNADEKERCLKQISDSANHLLGIINDVLDMSKIEAGKMELCETDFQIQDMLDQVTAVMNFKMKEKRQYFSVHTDENVPKSVIADKRMLVQVITNLLSNANKFTPEGGNIRLSIHKTEDFGNKCKLRIEVEDNGIGIPEEQQERLFDSFEQADNSISRKYGGTGLGLTISQKIINTMNGRIWIESQAGKGAKFIFTINVGFGSADENDGTDFSDTVDNTDLFTGRHILLADDVEINREILIAMLDGTGVIIDCAENGREVCDKFADNPEVYDLIFMDLHMPEIDGYEATKTIRGMKFTKAHTVPIIAVTADVFSQDVEKCLVTGMNDHVGKPLNVDTVIAKMKKYI